MPRSRGPGRGGPGRSRARSRPPAIAGALLLLVVVAGPGSAVGLVSGGSIALPGTASTLATSPSDAYNLCPTAGPVVLGIEWNCIAELDLTMLVLMLGAIGIAWYIYWDADAAELPGESEEIPLTEEEWGAVRALREERLRTFVPTGRMGGPGP